MSKRTKAYFLRILTRKNTSLFDIRHARSLLFFRYDRIGDIFLTTPVFRELKLEYPEINNDSYRLFAPKSQHSKMVFQNLVTN